MKDITICGCEIEPGNWVHFECKHGLQWAYNIYGKPEQVGGKLLVMVDNGFEKWARGVQSDGSQFADQCKGVLVKDWEADEKSIDMQSLLEMATGHLLSSCAGGPEENRMTPEDYIKNVLQDQSDYGLQKLGLTWEKYNERK